MITKITKRHPKEFEALSKIIVRVIELRDEARKAGDILLTLILNRYLADLEKKYNHFGGRRIHVV